MTTTVSTSRQAHIIDLADDLFDETISNALHEDFEFRSAEEVKIAINSLISRLRDLDPEDISIIEDDE